MIVGDLKADQNLKGNRRSKATAIALAVVGEMASAHITTAVAGGLHGSGVGRIAGA